MKPKQFNDFWEIRCPKCNEPIDVEIVLNLFRKRKLTDSEKKS